LKIDQQLHAHRGWHDATRARDLRRQPGPRPGCWAWKPWPRGWKTSADWGFLRGDAAAIMAQGYFIARPMPAAELPGWIASWQARRRDLVPAPAEGWTE
jgi:hypothetical protein